MCRECEGYITHMKLNGKDTVVVCYSLDGILIKTYPSARKAALSRKLHPRTIDRAIRGDIKTVRNLLWRRFDSSSVPNRIEPYKKKAISREAKPIGKLDENGNIVEIYSSLRKAAKNNNIDPHSLRDQLNNKYKYTGKTKFVYLAKEKEEN